jgi:hypothetical protein
MTQLRANRFGGLFAAFFLALGVGLFAPSCGEADKLFDCQSVCSRYQTCFNSSYDVEGCRTRCKDNADRDTEFKRKADDCESCIDDRSCSSATFSCATRCGGIVP